MLPLHHYDIKYCRKIFFVYNNYSIQVCATFDLSYLSNISYTDVFEAVRCYLWTPQDTCKIHKYRTAPNTSMFGFVPGHWYWCPKYFPSYLPLCFSIFDLCEDQKSCYNIVGEYVIGNPKNDCFWACVCTCVHVRATKTCYADHKVYKFLINCTWEKKLPTSETLFGLLILIEEC